MSAGWSTKVSCSPAFTALEVNSLMYTSRRMIREWLSNMKTVDFGSLHLYSPFASLKIFSLFTRSCVVLPPTSSSNP